MFKKTCVVFTILILLLTYLVPAVFGAGLFFYDGEWHSHQEKNITIYINNQKISPPVNPLIINDSTLVPARSIMEFLGASVLWVPDSRQVIIHLNTTNILLTIDKCEAIVNGKTELMPIPAKIVNDYTMIPLRFVSETLDYNVKFVSATNTIYISRPAPTRTPIPEPVYSALPENTTVPPTGAPSFSKENVIKNITYQTDASSMIIKFNTPVKTPYNHFALDNPDRIVVDIEKASVESSKDIIINKGLVTSIRKSNHDDYARIVVDLKKACKYTLKYDTSGYSLNIYDIEYDGIITPAPTPTPGPTAKPTTKPTVRPYPTIVPPTSPKPTVSATPTPTPTPTPVPIIITKPYLVCIDAGHGGHDPGALGVIDGKTVLEEADANLAIALLVNEKLRACGINTMMTRSTDKFVELNDISDMANKAGAYLFVSIHNNAIAGNPNINGSLVMSYLTENPDSPYAISSKELGTNVLNGLISATGQQNRGLVDGSWLSVVRKSFMPAVLVEVAFVTGTEDLQRLLDDEFINDAATGIANGILKSIKQVEKRTGETFGETSELPDEIK